MFGRLSGASEESAGARKNCDCRWAATAARSESFFAFEARPRRAEAVEVLGEKTFVYAAMSALGGGGLW